MTFAEIAALVAIVVIVDAVTLLVLSFVLWLTRSWRIG
jgi:hypothetical protein